jgi:hypothetical protein
MRRVFFPQVRGKNLYFDQYDMAVRFGVLPRFGVPAALASHPAAPESTGPGRVMVAQVAPDEFLFMDASVSIDIRPAYGSDFNTAQYLRIEEGSCVRSENHAVRESKSQSAIAQKRFAVYLYRVDQRSIGPQAHLDRSVRRGHGNRAGREVFGSGLR